MNHAPLAEKYIADRPRAHLTPARAVRLRAVLDDLEAVRSGEGSQARHIARLAVQVHRNDGPGAGRQLPFQQVQVHVARVRLDVHEHRRRAALVDRLRGGDERERGGEHLVSLSDAACEQREVERVRA